MKVAIITGASSGIGREFAVQLAGLDIADEYWLVARREEKLLELKSIIKNSKIFCLDMADENSVIEICNEVKKCEVEVVCLVNSAGFGRVSDAVYTNCEDISKMIDLNCKALSNLTVSLIPFMKEGSMIIQMGSFASFTPFLNMSVYSATKSYVLFFSRCLHFELKKKGIKVTCVCPGPVESEFFLIAQKENNLYYMTKYKKNIMADPKKVVKKAINDALKNKPVSVYSLGYRFLHLMVKVLPVSFAMRVSNRLSKKIKK